MLRAQLHPRLLRAPGSTDRGPAGCGMLLEFSAHCVPAGIVQCTQLSPGQDCSRLFPHGVPTLSPPGRHSLCPTLHNPVSPCVRIYQKEEDLGARGLVLPLQNKRSLSDAAQASPC